MPYRAGARAGTSRPIFFIANRLMIGRLRAIVVALSSPKWALVVLSGWFVLVFLGTLQQATYGIYATQQRFFHAMLVLWEPVPGVAVPVFPGGYLLGLALVICLVSTIIVHRLYETKKWWLLLIHLGVISLMVGGGITHHLGIEGQMALQEASTRWSYDHPYDIELVFFSKETPSKTWSISGKRLQDNATIADHRFPFSVHIKKIFQHANLYRLDRSPSSSVLSDLPLVTKGVGMKIGVEPRKPVIRDDVVNLTTAYVELKHGNGVSMGTWLVSRAFGMTQLVDVGGGYDVMMRAKRFHLPFSITLNDFQHVRYPGTDIPKHFSSLVHLHDPHYHESRDVLIKMNHPLRYRGYTFYQASFGEDDQLSVLQVVQNPSWFFPYLSCLLLLVGLVGHMIMRVRKLLKT